jgi:hypothetical protein
VLLCTYRKGACFIAGGFYAPLADDLKSSQRNSLFTIRSNLNEKTSKKEFGDFDRNEKAPLKILPEDMTRNTQQLSC